jgi:hypothetical protein
MGCQIGDGTTSQWLKLSSLWELETGNIPGYPLESVLLFGMLPLFVLYNYFRRQTKSTHKSKEEI